MKIRKHMALLVSLIMVLQLFSFSVMASPAFKTEYEVLTASECGIALTENAGWSASLNEQNGSVTIKNNTGDWSSYVLNFNSPVSITKENIEKTFLEMNVLINGGVPAYLKFAMNKNDGNDTGEVQLSSYLGNYNPGQTKKVYIPLTDFNDLSENIGRFVVQTAWGNYNAEMTFSDIKFVTYSSVKFNVSALSAESVSISWEAFEGAESYNIYQDGDLVKTVTENYADIDGLYPGNAYTYMITAKVGDEEGFFMPEKKITTPLSSELKPKKYDIFSAKINNTNITPGDDGMITASGLGDWNCYEVNLKKSVNLSSEQLEHAYLELKMSCSNSNWYYQIAAKDIYNNNKNLNLYDYGAMYDQQINNIHIPLKAFENVNSSFGYFGIQLANWGVVKIKECSIVICPETISKIEERSTPETQILTWNEIENAEKYVIYRDDFKIGETTNTVFEDKGLLANVPYTYRLSAVMGGEEVCLTPPTVLKTDYSAGGSYEIGLFKSGMKSLGNASIFSPSVGGNSWSVLNDPYYPSKFSATNNNGSGTYKVTSWGCYGQSAFSSEIDLSDADKLRNSALSFIAYGVVNGKTDNLRMYFYEKGGDNFYSSVSIPNINATLEESERTWVRYDIPLYQIGLNKNIEKILIGKDNDQGNSAEFSIDDMRITSLNPEVVSMYFYDENDNLVFDENGVIPKTVKKCKLRFNRELDEATIKNAKVLTDNRDIVKDRTYNDVYKEITLNFDGGLSAGQKIKIEVSESLESALAIGEAATNGGSVGTAYNVEKNPATEFSAEYSVAPENINYIRAINPGGYEIPSNVMIPMNVRGELEKGVADAPDMTLILAVYNSNGSLKAVDSKLISKADKAGKYQTEPISAAKGDKVKVMVFENLETLKPLFNSK